MPAADLTDWRAARAADGVPLPEPDDELEAVLLELDGVTAGGALLRLSRQGDRLVCTVLVIQTTVPPDAVEHWEAVALTLAEHARERGAEAVVARVDPGLTTAFGRAGFRATMLEGGGALDPGARPDLQEDHSVSVRPMTPAERVRFVEQAGEVVRAGMARAGVADPGGPGVAEIDAQLAVLAADPPPRGELLLTAVVDGEAVGSAWATLVPRGDAIDYHGRSMFLFPEHRGRGLSKSFLGALVRNAAELGVADVRFRLFGHDTPARTVFVPGHYEAEAVTDVYVRKDLDGPRIGLP